MLSEKSEKLSVSRKLNNLTVLLFDEIISKVIRCYNIILIRNSISRIISVWSLFSSIRFHTSSTDSFEKLVFCIFVLFYCVEFNVTFMNFTTFALSLLIQQVQVTLCFCSHLFLKRDTRHHYWNTNTSAESFFNKKHASFENLTFTN